MPNLNETINSTPVTAGDLLALNSRLEERFRRLDSVIMELVGLLDAYPGHIGPALEDRIERAFADRDMAGQLRSEFEELTSSPERAAWNQPLRKRLLLGAWAENPDMTLAEVADVLERELFGELVAEGVPAEKARKVAGAVADKVEAGDDPGDRKAQAAHDLAEVKARGSKFANRIVAALGK